MKTHGLSKSNIYGIWNAMMMRCYNPNRTCYPNYGGRGIRVCKRWHKFDNFRKDMELTYEVGLTLERDNVNGNYSKNNCRWILFSQQAKNRRNTIVLEINGEKISVPDASNKYNVSAFCIYDRLSKGYSHKESVFGKQKDNLSIKLGWSGSLDSLAKSIGISKNTIYNRFNAGYPIDKCLLTNFEFTEYLKLNQ